MRHAVAFFALSAALIAGAWWWLGQPVQMPQSPLGPGEKVPCVSYAPFRGAQNPLVPTTRVERWQIEEDLAQLKPFTDCIRTYSVDLGLDQIPAIARRHGMKVLQGLWLSSKPELNRIQIETTIALAKEFPDVIQAVIVGNEVLLRGEMSAADLVKTIRAVKSQVTMPVTYADVWEFWLRNRDVAAAVDYVTIHILPYWEDFPLPARETVPHLESIRSQVATAFPGKDIMIGEVGWPSAGRMREGARPGPATQALVLHEVVAAAKRNKYRVNLIEAYDQPWKRALEGTVGGHWGLIDAYERRFKFAWGEAVSNHPLWRWQAAGGVAFALAVFAAAFVARRSGDAKLSATAWLGVAAVATASGATIGWTVANIPLESLGAGGWARSLAWTFLALTAPIVGAMAISSGATVATFADLLGRRGGWSEPMAISVLLGALLIGLAVLAVQAALGLVFDPRYRDFAFAPLTGAAAPFLVLAALGPRPKGSRPMAEKTAAAVLALSAVYIVFNESLANWQALWFSGGLLALAVILLAARDGRG